MVVARRFYRLIFLISEWAAMAMLAIMTLIVFGQVVTRYLFDFTPPWSEEVALLLMVWFGFLGVAVATREGRHMRIDLLDRVLGPGALRATDLLGHVLLLGFGVFMVVQGWELVKVTSESTLAATKLPSAVLYLAVPLSGLAIALHELLALAGALPREEGPK